MSSILLTNNSKELIRAAVRKETAHSVSTREGGQTLLTVLIGLEEKSKQWTKISSDMNLSGYSTEPKGFVSDSWTLSLMCDSC